jgi:hypothetical protein
MACAVAVAYGAPHKHATFRLTRADLDEHFGCPVVANVDRATAAYREVLQSALAVSVPQSITGAAALR